jgi:hypothetical protein
MYVISFSLWGDDDKFFKGACENIEFAKDLYPDWVCKFYCRNDVPSHVMEKIEELGGLIEVVPPPYRGDWEGLFWRFRPAWEDGVQRMICRDTDSRINPREVAAVDEWLDSELDFHVMRDHIQHTVVSIPGGMWGIIGKVLDIKKITDEKWGEYGLKGCDQDFLTKEIWPIVKTNALVHDKYPEGVNYKGGYNYTPLLWGGDIRPFPPHDGYNSYKYGKFVGSRIGED